MSLAFDEEQAALQTSARRFLQSRCPPSHAREQMEASRGWCDDVWQQIAHELGWCSIPIPEAHGGAGLGPVELVALFEETGRSLYSGPLFSTLALGANLIESLGSDLQQARWLPDIATGAQRATALIHGGFRASRTPQGLWHLEGSGPHVLDGQTADWVVVPAETASGMVAFVVPGADFHRTPTPTLDMGRRLCALSTDGLTLDETTRLTAFDDAHYEAALDRAQLYLAAEQLGAAEQCLDAAVEYAKLRHQFGRAIGSFQAVKHQCADMMLRVESCRSAVYYAAWAAATGAECCSEAVSAASIYATEAFEDNAAASIQIHGGIGFTWEHDAHLYYKRARGSRWLIRNLDDRWQQFEAQCGLGSER